MATVTGSATFANTATVPDDGVTTVNGASVATPIQTVLNNTKFLYDGVINIRSVTSSAALKALTGMANRQVAVVCDSASNRLGLFMFFTGTALADITSKRYAANSATGNWYVASYDSATNQIVALYTVNNSSAQSTSDAAYTDVPSSSATISSVVAGDKLKISYSFEAWMTNLTESGYARCAVNDGGTDYAVNGEHAVNTYIADIPLLSCSGHAIYTAVASGTAYVKLQYKATSGTIAMPSPRPRSITIEHIRP